MERKGGQTKEENLEDDITIRTTETVKKYGVGKKSIKKRIRELGTT